MKTNLFTIIALLATTLIFSTALTTLTNVTTLDDFFLPGSQINQSGNIETPDKCDNCHGGYDKAVEPAFQWRGNMMAQAARDPLFYACLAIANQDAPNAGDLCLRCHSPYGWLRGRCVPTDGSALNKDDRDGVQCDFCHKMVRPTPLGVNPYPNDPLYNSSVYGNITYNQDQAYMTQIIPIPGAIGGGMYIADSNNGKRGPFADATGRHQMFYSPFHKESALCGTCHDVSNPVFTRTSVTDSVYAFNMPGVQSPTFDPKLMFPIERTYGEWKSSGYNAPGTAAHKTCQACHMRPVTGKGAKMKDAPIRNNVPLHDMTGGNTFTPNLVKQVYPAEVNHEAIDSAIVRARETLLSASDLELTVTGNVATVKVINKTGHKLPTGYPEGRRIWINLVAYNSTGNIIYESGAYNYTTAELIHDPLIKIYQQKPGTSQGPSFHMALNNKIWFDNRIPPMGFTNALLIENQADVVGAYYPDGQNWDLTSYNLPQGTVGVEVKLLYQTTTKEYVEFLRDENVTNTKGLELYNLWVANGKGAPEIINQASWGNVTPALPEITAQIISVTRNALPKSFFEAQALVSVTSNNLPVQGATVTASYTGPNSGNVTGVTNVNGEVILKTASKKNPSGLWCFTVTNVSLTGYTYVPNTTPLCEMTLSNFMLEQSLANAETTLNIFPNPFVEKAFFELISADDARAKIEIFRTDGSKLSTLIDYEINAGVKTIVEFNPPDQVSGLYFYRVTIGGKVFTGKLIMTGR